MNGVNGKKGLIKKTLERCKSLAAGMGRKGLSSSYDDDGDDDDQRRQYAAAATLKRRSKSWPRLSSSSPSKRRGRKSRSDKNNKCRVAPEGCFSVYVGEEKQRFVIKTEYVNHPLFKMLLEEAESEYGYTSEGPLALPCDVDFFVKVLVQMDDYYCDEQIDQDHRRRLQGCSRFGSYHLLTPPRLVAINQF